MDINTFTAFKSPIVTSVQFNNICVKELERSDFRGRIAVIGSGPSCPFITSIDQLIDRLKRSCGIRRKPNEAHWSFFERACQRNPRKYFNAIKKSFDHTPLWDARAYLHLLAINFKSYVTFNYDDQLPTAFKRKHQDNFSDLFSVYPTREGEKSFQPGDLIGHKSRLAVIHGYRNEEDPLWHKRLVLRISDYNQHYGDGRQPDGKKTCPELYGWWHNLLTTQPCVFIGTSLREPGLYRVVEDLVKDGNESLMRQDHIHLRHVERMSQEPFYEKPIKLFGAIRQVPFDRMDKDFNGLLYVLSPFSHIPIQSPVPKMPMRTAITINSQFPF